MRGKPGYRVTQWRGKLAIDGYDLQGTRLRRSLGTNDRGLAEARAGEIWQRLTAPPGDRVKDLFPSYKIDRATDNVNTRRLDDNWQRLQPFFGHMIGTAITRTDCRAFHKAQRAAGYSDSTIRTDLEILRACLNLTLRENAPKLWINPPSKPRDRWLTREEAIAVVEAAKSPHVRLFIVLGLTTAARAGAILELTWDRVDFKSGVVDYRSAGREQTNKRNTLVPMNDRARTELQAAHDARLTDHVIEYAGKPVKSVKKAIQRLSEESGITFSPHVLRHTCGVWMAQADVPMQKIAQFMGHTSLRVTEKHYARYSPSYMQDAGTAVNW